MKFPKGVGACGRPRCMSGSAPRVPEERREPKEEGAVLIPPLSPPGVTVGPHCGAHTLRLHHLCRTCGTGPEARPFLLECGQYLVTATAGYSTVHVGMYCTFSAQFERCLPLVTELAGGSRGHRAGCELEVGLCLDHCPSPVLSRQRASLAPQGCEGSRTQRLCQQLCQCLQVPTPGCRSLGWPCCHAAPRPPSSVAEGAQRSEGEMGCASGLEEPEEIHSAVSQSLGFCSIPKPRLLGF